MALRTHWVRVVQHDTWEWVLDLSVATGPRRLLGGPEESQLVPGNQLRFFSAHAFALPHGYRPGVRPLEPSPPPRTRVRRAPQLPG